MPQRNHVLALLIVFCISKTIRAETTNRDSFPVHYLLMDSIGINYKLEKNLFALTQKELQNTSLPWWDKSVLYRNYFSSAINLFLPITQIKEIWAEGYENDPYSSCEQVASEYDRMKSMEYYKNIPHVMHCVLRREKDFFNSRCNVIYEQYDSLLIKELTLMRNNTKYNNDIQSRLDSLIAKAGKYPGRSMVGIGLESAAWSMIQRADITVLEKYLPLLKNAVRSKDLHPRYLAESLDKVEVLKGQPQIYGTQYFIKGEKEEPYPIRDMKNLNTLRTGMGLGLFGDLNSNLGNYMEKTKQD